MSRRRAGSCSATPPGEWAKSPVENTKRISDFEERLAAEGEICWRGMHSWRRMLELLDLVDRPTTLGFRADMAHTLLYTVGYNAPEDLVLPENADWNDEEAVHGALKRVASALRPWTIDFHLAQNDGTVKGMRSDDKTGRHCLPNDPNGKLWMVEGRAVPWDLLVKDVPPKKAYDLDYLVGMLDWEANGHP